MLRTATRDSHRLYRQLAPQSVSREYANGQAIFAQGEPANAMFRIEHGHVKIAIAPQRGKKAATSILQAGDCFGEGCLVKNATRASTATSMRASTIGRISKRSVARRLRDEPAFSKIFTAHLLHRIGKAETDLAHQRVSSSEMRLARLLLQLCDFGNLKKRAPTCVTIDQGTLAQVVGTTRSRVSYFMNRFRQRGFIEYNGTLRVHRSLLVFLLGESTPA